MSNPETAVMNPARSDVIDGYTLTRPGLSDYAAIEDEFTEDHIGVLIRGAVKAGISLDDAMASASKVQKARPFGYGTADFDKEIQYPLRAPLALWFTLKAKQPSITRAQAEALIPKDKFADVRRAALEMWGYDFSPPPKNAGTPPTSESQSSGDQSKERSANAA